MSVKPPTGTVGFRADDGPGYPNWTHRRMGEVLTVVRDLSAVYNDHARHNTVVDTGFYRQQMRVLYDLLREDGR